MALFISQVSEWYADKDCIREVNMSKIHFLPTQFKYIQNVINMNPRISGVQKQLEADYLIGHTDCLAICDIAEQEWIVRNPGVQCDAFGLAKLIADMWFEQKHHMQAKPSAPLLGGMADFLPASLPKTNVAPQCHCPMDGKGIGHYSNCEWLKWKRAQ